MNHFDQASRYLLKQAPEAFFTWLGPRFVENWNFRGWLDTSTIAFPGDPPRTCDTVADFQDRSSSAGRCAVNVEFQTEPDADMLERLGEYAFRLRREKRPRRGKYEVFSVLIQLTGAPRPHVLEMTSAELGGSLRLEAVQRILRDEDAGENLNKIASGELSRWILPWLVLMKRAAQEDNIRR